jgi:hypothetical protein
MPKAQRLTLLPALSGDWVLQEVRISGSSVQP